MPNLPASARAPPPSRSTFVPWELAHAAVWGIALAGGEPTPVHQALLALTWLLVGANAVAIGAYRRAVYDAAVGTRVVRGGVRG